MSISVQNLTKRFGTFVALDHVSLVCPTGQLVALLGRAALAYQRQDLAALEANVIAYDPYAPDSTFAACRARKVTLEHLFEQATVVTVHAPVTNETKKMIGKDLLRRLPDGGLIVNTARGAIIDEQALAAELVCGRLRAALDVTDPEPPDKDSPLYGLPNVLITPHQAGQSLESLRRQGLVAVEDLRIALAGQKLAHAVTLRQWDILA